MSRIIELLAVLVILVVIAGHPVLVGCVVVGLPVALVAMVLASLVFADRMQRRRARDRFDAFVCPECLRAHRNAQSCTVITARTPSHLRGGSR